MCVRRGDIHRFVSWASLGSLVEEVHGDEVYVQSARMTWVYGSDAE